MPIAQTAEDFDSRSRDRVIASIESQLKNTYIDLPIAERMNAALTAHQRAGDYDGITDRYSFAFRLTKDLQAVSQDRHLRVEFAPFPQQAMQTEPSAAKVAIERAQALRDNCAFKEVKILPNNIGYIKFDAFRNPDLCAHAASAAIASVAHCSALIVDMRENGGGYSAMVNYIATYFFNKPTHLTDIYTRKNDNTQQHWTLPAVPGERLATQPIYVLTSKDTFSAAEEFSYDLQAQKRALVIGEATGGGAHPIHSYPLTDSLIIYVPESRPINPITHTDWEGKGVIPDISVSAIDALSVAETLATQKIQGKPQ
jgi:C-terminal processing protease CtpA/Prc